MKILVEILSMSMGDTIAAMPYIDKFREVNNYDVYVKLNSNLKFLFVKSYNKLKFVDSINDEFEKVLKLDYVFTKNVQEGYANQLGFINWTYIKPKLLIDKNKRPFSKPYVTIGIHSTSQLKYWNHPTGDISQPFSPYWNELCKMIRKSGLTPVVVERDKGFGVPPYFNEIPKKAVPRYNLTLEESVNIIQHSEFFIGLSSGTSWLSHGLGKKVAMIANFTEDWNEFDLSDSDYIRITNKNVCHGCWNKINKEYNFDSGDWYWCPLHKGTNRQFECHTSITPDKVFNLIEPWIKESLM